MRILFFFLFLLNVQVLHAQCSYIGSFKTDSYGGPSKTVKSGNILFFSAYDTIHGRELWCTDGTKTGTYMVKDIYPGITNGIDDYFELTSYNLNGIVYFRGNDGVTGTELWRSDGTPIGTYLVKDLYAGTGNSSIGYFADVNNILYFTANTGTTLWRSDGTSTGTYILKSFSIATNLYGYNGNLYFSADDSNNGQELWKSNGTTSGTQLLKDLNGAPGASLPCNFHATPNALYFMAATNDGWEMWKTTGSASSTVMVKDINPAGNGVMDFYSEAKIVSIGTTVYFRANDGIAGFQLWKSDGTASGTVRVTNLANGVDAYCTLPVVNGNVLVNNYMLNYFWLYDPTMDSSYMTGYPNFSYFNTNTNKFAFIGSSLYYAGKDTAYGCEMWQSDGTTNGPGIIQETHLTDNWTYSALQGFNAVFGVLGTQLLFTLAREPYNTNIPLFVYDSSNPGSCFPPSVVVPVPTSDTSAHMVWNRIFSASQYEFRYRITGNNPWTISGTSLSYLALNNLNASTVYEYQLRAACGGSWSNWSDTMTYHTAYVQNDYILHMLAERSENATTERIYWLKTPSITKAKIRYRPVGTTTWNSIVNSNGYFRLIALLPNTLYEYQYRALLGSTWDEWYPSLRYFVTTPATAVSVNEVEKPALIIFPNPANGMITIAGVPTKKVNYNVFDDTGRLIKSGKLTGNQLDISDLKTGIYLLVLQFENHSTMNRIVKQ